MDRRADIIVTSADHTPQLVVEVKNRTDMSPEWAARLRRNLFAHAAVLPTPFFMLALPDRFYLWKGEHTSGDAPADYVIDASDLLRPYSGGNGAGEESSSGYALELMISSWLHDLLRAEHLAPDERLAWLFDSGLYDAIRHGAVHTEASV
ncbi:hypothetical protein BH24GEM3_BH24GEM3_24740 [soil metagenome]|jgi:hypothetical protein|nr:hypothetical protein [Gemmatimonadota bacterium]